VETPVIYISLLGIPMILLVVHLLMVLVQPSVDARHQTVQSARRSGLPE
jgi:hypothetical protein